MRLIIDTDRKEVIEETPEGLRAFSLHSPEAFQLISKQWLITGWNAKYTYSFSWLGRPIIQLPEDLIRIQEIIFDLQPDVIIETGIAHGGSLIFYASLCKTLEKGRIIGVDIEIRPHNRKAIESHFLSNYITLIEGNSTDKQTLTQIQHLIKPTEKVLILLDSCHTKSHVLAELQAYSPLVTMDSYIVATDGIMADLSDVPRGKPEWKWDNPQEAAKEFVLQDSRFQIEEPRFPFNEGHVTERITHWPSAFVKRVA
jgi:cephalosporin hydroxylase